ncbi:AzlC family ABC transporter permease [Caldovatus aquaticus]|uniref:AzlC family ABC transporter permease n=1 Tax=Caldovatus aquaticus TaxID=2865671 RepID=A0ABS7F617_9PROT|nr:AzlC family ABC transporter permease [Caldovatus aquaticus]MBW8271004.1 AzlC family ABC transporter permease [Caldovatus aquaticus]
MVRPSFTGQGVRRGLRAALPLVLGTFPFGLAVGVAAHGKGLSLLEALLMSGLTFAGTAQLVALELWTEPAPLLAAVFATFLVNLRMAPMGAALAAWFERVRGWRLWVTLGLLTDQAYALATVAQRRGPGRDAGFLFGVGLLLWLFWLVAVGAGHGLAEAVRLRPSHPLFFAPVAVFVALLVPLWRGLRQDAAPWGLAAAVALAARGAGLGPPWPLLLGALAGAALAAAREAPAGEAPPGPAPR